MKWISWIKLTFYFVTIFFYLPHCVKSDKQDDNNILTLSNNADFEKVLKDHKSVAVLFIISQCKNCETLLVEVKKVSKDFPTNNKKNPVKFALANLDKIGFEVDKKYQLNTFPNFKFFHNNLMLNYTGNRTAENITEYLNNYLNPASIAYNDLDSLLNLMANNRITIVGLFKNSESKESRAFQNVAVSYYEKAAFAMSHETDIFTHFQITSDNAILHLKNFDDKRIDFNGVFTSEIDILSFIKLNSRPWIEEYDVNNARDLFLSDTNRIFVAFLSKSAADFEDVKSKFAEIGRLFKGKILATFVDVDNAIISEQILQFFQIDKSNIPAYGIVDTKNRGMKPFVPPKSEMKHETMVEFVQNVLDGVLKEMSREEKNDKKNKKSEKKKKEKKHSEL